MDDAGIHGAATGGNPTRRHGLTERKRVTPHDRFARLRRPALPNLHRTVVFTKRTDDEVLSACAAQLIDEGRDLSTHQAQTLLKNLLTAYRLIEGRAYGERTDRGYASWFQFASGLYEGIETREDAMRKRTSMGNWFRILVAVGLVELEEVRDDRGASRGLRWRLCSGERGCSSVGWSVTSRLRVHVTTRLELPHARKLPHRRGDVCPAKCLSFGDLSVTPYGVPTALSCQAVRPMAGQRGVRMQDRPPTRTRGAAEPPTPTAGLERRGTEELRQLAREGADPVELLEDAWRTLFDCSPRLSHRKWGRVLVTACRRADRYGELGCPTAGYGVGWVIDRMQEDQIESRRPHSLAFYAQRLDFESRQWRRHWKPQIRADRAAFTEVVQT